MAFDKLKFWKKDDDLGFSSDNDLGLSDSGVPSYSSESEHDPMSHPDFQQPQQQYPEPASFPGQQQPEQYDVHEQAIGSRDVELILAKLDMIKSELDSLHQRVRKIEQATETQQQQKKYW